MSKNNIYLTPEGAEKLQGELDQLIKVKRPDLSKRLRHAISMGDLSENADYIIAKEEQAFLEGRIQELEATLRSATIISHSGRSDRIELGSVVRISDGEGEPIQYRIVGAKEADPRNGKISNESPLGQALLGKEEGEVAVADTPTGNISFKIIEILDE